MIHYKSVRSVFVAVACMLAFGYNASALEVLSGDNTANVDAQLQLHAAAEHVDDPWNDSTRLFLFMRQARLSVNGVVNGVDYEVQWQLGGAEVPERNSVMSLLDAYANVPFVEDLFEVKIGQFKVPYGRERLLDSGDMAYADRSIANNFFNIGRDVGAAMHTKQGIFTGALGIFTGGGINIPERYIPEDLEYPMVVGRVGVNSGADRSVFEPSMGDADGVGFAAYLNALYTRDSRVGHSTPLNVKYYDKSTILMGDYNPYIGVYGEKADFYQVSADAAVTIPVGDEADLELSGEVHYSDFSNNAGDLQNVGGVIGATVLAGDWAVGVRYAVVDVDEEMGYSYEDDDGNDVFAQLTDKVIQEITPSIVYFWREYNLKIIADVTVHLDVPVSREPGNGVYNLIRQPDQISYASRGGIELQDNAMANLILQFNF